MVTWGSPILGTLEAHSEGALGAGARSAKNERDAWQYIKKQTLERVDRVLESDLSDRSGVDVSWFSSSWC